MSHSIFSDTRESRRRRVSQALIDLCFERGYRNISVEDVCSRAGVERAVFEREYADLEDCFCETYLPLRERIMAGLAEACEGLSGWRERLRATAYATQRILSEDERLTHFVINEVRSAGERPLLMVTEAVEQLFDLLDEGRDETDRASVSRATAESVGGGIFTQISAAVARGEMVDGRMVPQMLYAAVLPYVGHEAAMEELTAPPPQTEAAARRYDPAVAARASDGGETDWADLGPLPGGRHGLSPEQVAESQRERLLAAAAQIVAEHGYQGTTITEIAKRAAVANRAFYANFQTKEQCVLAAIEAVLGHLRDLLAEAAAAEDTWPESVLAALREALRFFGEEHELARLCLLAPITSTPAIAARFTDLLGEAVPHLAAGRAERSENANLPASTEDALLGGLISLISRSLAADRPLPELSDLAEFVLAPYLGAAEASRIARPAA